MANANFDVAHRVTALTASRNRGQVDQELLNDDTNQYTFYENVASLLRQYDNNLSRRSSSLHMLHTSASCMNGQNGASQGNGRRSNSAHNPTMPCRTVLCL